MSKTQHQFKGLKDWIEVFKTGTHTDSKGRHCTFNEADLDQVVSNMALGDVPAVLGHPKHNDPAYGWVKADGVKREGDSLFVKFADINPDFEKGVDSGAYRNRSVSIYKDPDAGWRLQHVGWLGAAPPAISGLQPLDYSAKVDAYEFSISSDLDLSWALIGVAALLRSLREQIVADKGVEAADATIPNWRIDSIAESAERVRQRADEDNASPQFQSPSKEPLHMTTITQEQLDAAKAQAKAEAKAEAEAHHKAEFAKKDAELVQIKAAQQAVAIAGQIDKWKALGVLTPAEEPGLAEFMSALQQGATGEFNFSGADKSAAKKTPAQYFADFMSARKPVVKLGSSGQASGGADPIDPNNSAAMADAALTYIKQQADLGITVSVPDAVAHVSAPAA